MSRLSNIPIICSMLLLIACASDGQKKQTSQATSDSCPPGQNMICEVSRTSRMRHGTFSNSSKRCGCEEATEGATIIPGINQ